MKHYVIALALCALSSCGAAYHSSRVIPGTTDTAKVRVLPITAQNILLANRQSYTPRTLPAAFHQTANGGSGLRTGGIAPDPVYTAEVRPPSLETRLPPATNPTPYRIGIGDVVLLATPSSTSAEQLSGLLAAQISRQGYTVQDDGSIAIASAGRVEIADLTLEEAEAQVFQHLVKAQIEPTFSLEIAEFNSKKIAIGGAVARPGVLPITLAPLELKQALAQAGGVTGRTTDFTSVRLYRAGTIYQIPLDSLYSSPKLGAVFLQEGDSLFVDDAYSLDRAEAYFRQHIQLAEFRQNNRRAALQNLGAEIEIQRAALDEQRGSFLEKARLGAVERDYVYLSGEVQKQGRMPLPLERQASLADALFEGANGLSIKTADPRHVYVLRGSTDPMEFDALTAWQIDLRNAANLSLAARFELRPNDVVFVAEQPVTRWSRTIDQISPSLITMGVSATQN
ncbi:polysaccharide biosynthesis/export family protein [Aliiroseovarius sp. KMU-50]|uniref:Polysaccharide biosynthesis/export family protein n=1 Tax=Aliiroseovarius salicola TaxID=3009082 RepID=A0ABT4VXU1_9RHOB|nr:polysaccharide biosynthesis/export family protein [Aliiroseovarius sp. KMU-50]MDA5093083.1 polysaccharide biosynthesis/export family protein [Aliiroseovarius sp. KMU-50]